MSYDLRTSTHAHTYTNVIANLTITVKFANKLIMLISYFSKKIWSHRSSHPEMFLRKIVLKLCSKYTGEHPYRSLILIKLQSNFIEIALREGSSPVNLLPIFRTHFPKSISGWLLLKLQSDVKLYRIFWEKGKWSSKPMDNPLKFA